MVEARKPAEDILEFMHRATVVISKDHRQKSPLCMSTKMEYVSIPMEEGPVGSVKGGTA